MLITSLAKNQTVYTDPATCTFYFQSYSTLLCEYDAIKKVLLLYGNGYRYSRTTSKYFNRFLEQLLIDPEVVKTVIKSNTPASDGAIKIKLK